MKVMVILHCKKYNGELSLISEHEKAMQTTSQYVGIMT